MKNILLITGLNGGTAVLKPLQISLVNKGYTVEVWNIFNALDHDILKEKTRQAQLFDVIVGWSLGSQLASLLVTKIECETGHRKILITVASNPCFVASALWPYAMEKAAFDQYQTKLSSKPIKYLKKIWLYGCSRNSSNEAKSFHLHTLIQLQNLTLLRQGLYCLEHLNYLEILEKYQGYQYHLFAQQDFLVNYKVQ